MDRLKAPAAKVIPYFEDLEQRGRAIAAMPIGTPDELRAAEWAGYEWYQLVFKALERGFEGHGLRYRLNTALPQNDFKLTDEQKFSNRMAEQLEVVADALTIARRRVD